MHAISGVILIVLIVFTTCSAATPESPEVSLTGQVVREDIEGGFFGIVTPDGTRYLPLNLPEIYQFPNLTIDVTGAAAPDVISVQMWGEPVTILSVKPVNRKNPFVQPWYAPERNRSVSRDEDQAEHLLMTASGLQAGLDAIDRRLAGIAKNLTKNGLKEKEPDRKLEEGLDEPGILFLTDMDTAGTITSIVPDTYEEFEGENVRGQDFTKERLTYPAPIMSEYFRLVEGMDAVILSYPVFSADKKAAGYISAVIDPANLTGTYALPFLNGTGYDLMIAEPDGTILYHTDPKLSGQEIWDNPEFIKDYGIHSLAVHFQNAMAGIDYCSCYGMESGSVATKKVTWTTVGLHDTAWRVLLISG
ncbi:MAG: cache domain-containing protein [Methanospirillaceae archaeon]|nr:cache domain-containing protein [Methanospirillaceae archaeon]